MKVYDVVPGLEFSEEDDLKQSPAWFLDATHSVPPWTPMFGWFWINFCRHGMQYGAETLSLPTVKGWDWRFKDGGGYLCLLFVDSDKEKEERQKKFREAIRPFVDNYEGLWGGYVKEMLKRYDQVKALNLDTATNIQLLENFEEVINTCRRMWEIHMHMMYGTYTPYVLFEQLCKQMLNIDDTHPTFQKLVSGFDNESFRIDRRLWEFSKKAREMGLQDLFLETPAKQIKAKLETSGKGKTFLKEFDQFLDAIVASNTASVMAGRLTLEAIASNGAVKALSPESGVPAAGPDARIARGRGHFKMSPFTNTPIGLTCDEVLIRLYLMSPVRLFCLSALFLLSAAAFACASNDDLDSTPNDQSWHTVNDQHDLQVLKETEQEDLGVRKGQDETTDDLQTQDKEEAAQVSKDEQLAKDTQAEAQKDPYQISPNAGDEEIRKVAEKIQHADD